MYDDEDAVAPVTVGRAFHVFAPWVALVAVILVVWSAIAGFQRGGTPAPGIVPEPTVGESTSPTSTVEEVKDLEAVARKSLKLRGLPNDQSEVIANVKKGTVLEILLKDAGHFKVRDKAGHIGWIPNDGELIAVRDKKK